MKIKRVKMVGCDWIWNVTHNGRSADVLVELNVACEKVLKIMERGGDPSTDLVCKSIAWSKFKAISL